MLKKLLAGRRRSTPVFRIPDGQRVYAIGDVHGCRSLLDRLIDAIAADDAARAPMVTTRIFLGDIVDRGPDSAGAIDRLRELAAGPLATRFLLGNHEEMFLAAIERRPNALRTFTRIGGRETILSYGIDRDSYDAAGYAELADMIDAAVPADHIAFLRGFEDQIVVGDYAFVHAGIRPDIALDAQKPSDLRWIREPFLGHRGLLSHRIVHGHTISEDVVFMPHRIGTDTGAYQSGRLSAVGIEGDTAWPISVSA